MRTLLFIGFLAACTPVAEDATAIDPTSLVLPQSTSAVAANEELPTIILTKKRLVVAQVPHAALDRPIGIESMDGPIIVPLRAWLKDPSIHGHDVAVAFDSDVTAEVAFEVLATCLEAGLDVFHLAVQREGATAQIPLAFGKPDPPNSKTLTAQIFRGGVILKVPEGNVAPGCEALGDGVTVSRLDGLVDRDRLDKCVARMHKDHPTNLASVLVTKDTEFHEIVTVLDAIRKEGATESIALGISN
jgi:biopolymer transport protein ExbD